MKVYKAYDIADEVSSRPALSNDQIENIELVIKMILDNLASNKIYYQVPNERVSDKKHPVIGYNQKVFEKRNVKESDINKELDNLAKKLLFEEQIEENDGTRRRNRKIKEGLLFAKHTSENLILLKFEEIKIMDRITFKPIEGLSVDKQYYKIVVFNKNSFDGITVVDRNKVIAKYWASGFLELERQRDSYVNTTDLVNYLEDDRLINPDIGFTYEDYQDIKGQVKDFIFDNKTFDREEVFSTLKFDSKKYVIDSNDLFSKDLFNVLDAEFSISADALLEKYRRTIKISSSAKVMVDNLYKELKRKNIELKGNKLTLTVDKDYKEKVRKMLEIEAENG